MEKHKCPNCSRVLTNEEMYCYFCEMEIERLGKKQKEGAKIKNRFFSEKSKNP